MEWHKLVGSNESILFYGTYFMFPATYPFEDRVVWMLGRSWDDNFPMNFVTITGRKAGARNPLQQLPKECLLTTKNARGLDVKWLIDNWKHWVYPEGEVEDVWFSTDTLTVDALSTGDIQGTQLGQHST